MSQNTYDVAIIGSGIGGLCAGALLANKGYRVLLIEKLPRLGGRFSTVEYEGFKLPTGAVAIERGRNIDETFNEVGVELKLRDTADVHYWIKGQWFPLPEKGQIRALFDMLGKTTVGRKRLMARLARETAYASISGALTKAVSTGEGEKEKRSFRDWLTQYTDDPDVIALFRSLTSALSTVNDFEYPASHWFKYISSKGMKNFRSIGIAPDGNVHIAESLADVVRRKGGTVWTESPVKRIIISAGRASGLIIERDGKEVEISARAVISNAGPVRTLEMAGRENFTEQYLREVDTKIRPAPMMITYITSDKPLVELPGILIMVGLRRIVDGMCVTMSCPELAPPGQHLTITWGTPASCLHHVDKAREAEENMEDIRHLFPDFERHGRVLKMELRDIDDEFPAARTWPGYDVSHTTPIDNLFNVGDGVKPPGWGGMPACAKSARNVVEELYKILG